MRIGRVEHQCIEVVDAATPQRFFRVGDQRLCGAVVDASSIRHPSLSNFANDLIALAVFANKSSQQAIALTLETVTERRIELPDPGVDRGGQRSFGIGLRHAQRGDSGNRPKTEDNV